MKRIREKFTFSNVMALTAVFIAMGGSAYAGAKIGTSQLKKNAVTTPKIKNGAVSKAKLKPGLIRWAHIASSGDELHGSGFTSTRLSPGIYRVTFVERIDMCALQATPDAGWPSFANATVDGGSGGKAALLQLADSTGSLADQQFYLTVIC